MKLRLIDPERLIPDAHTAAEAAVRGVEALIIEHLRNKNDGTKPNRWGMPKTKYYADAAKNVEASVDGATVRVEIDHPGISMHYEGGTVYPKKKEASCITVGLFDTDSGVKRCEHGAQSAECLQRAA